MEIGAEIRPELADIGRITKRLVTRTVTAARAEEQSVGRLLADHLGPQAAALPVAKGIWPVYDRVNVQTGVNVWLAEPGRTHTLVGLTNYRHRDLSMSDLMQTHRHAPGIGNVETEALPAGPGDETLPCVACGLYLIEDAQGRAVILLRGPEEHGSDDVRLEVSATSPDRAPEIVAEIKRLSIEHNIFRGHVIAFGDEVFSHHCGALLSFVDQPEVSSVSKSKLERMAASISGNQYGTTRAMCVAGGSA